MRLSGAANLASNDGINASGIDTGDAQPYCSATMDLLNNGSAALGRVSAASSVPRSCTEPALRALHAMCGSLTAGVLARFSEENDVERWRVAAARRKLNSVRGRASRGSVLAATALPGDAAGDGLEAASAELARLESEDEFAKLDLLLDKVAHCRFAAWCIVCVF